MNQGLYSQASHCLLLADPVAKCDAVGKFSADYQAGLLILDENCPVPSVRRPGRPVAPELVAPSKVARRRLGSIQGRVALLHAIAHIEFNAINLALDAVCRFRGMPIEYYSDWISVAADEARHFSLLVARLKDFEAVYGDLPAHNGLWEMAETTADSCLIRMALVPRVLEARGLDVTPGMIVKLKEAGDTELVKILEVIYQDEIGHVQIGSHWFNECCLQQSLDPSETFDKLLDDYMDDAVIGSFDSDVRAQAGFSKQEIQDLIQRRERAE